MDICCDKLLPFLFCDTIVYAQKAWVSYGNPSLLLLVQDTYASISTTSQLPLTRYT